MCMPAYIFPDCISDIVFPRFLGILCNLSPIAVLVTSATSSQ